MKKTIVLTAWLLLGSIVIASAQHAGHGGSSGGLGPMAPDNSMRDMQRMMRLQASKEQGRPYMDYAQAAQQIRKHAEAISSSGSHSSADLDQFRHHYHELKVAINGFDDTHEAFVRSLRQEQLEELQDQLRKITRLREDLETRVQVIDKELNASTPNPKRVVDASKKIDKFVKEWEKQHHAIGSAMGLQG